MKVSNSEAFKNLNPMTWANESKMTLFGQELMKLFKIKILRDMMSTLYIWKNKKIADNSRYCPLISGSIELNYLTCVYNNYSPTHNYHTLFCPSRTCFADEILKILRGH